MKKSATATRKMYRDNMKSGLWSYSMRYDAYYVTKTRAWVEDGCRDPWCMYCSKRPPLAPKSRRYSTLAEKA